MDYKEIEKVLLPKQSKKAPKWISHKMWCDCRGCKFIRTLI